MTAIRTGRNAIVRRGRALLVLVALGAALLSAGSFAFADGRVDFLAARLQYPPPAGQADDFRVRTTAALALGGTNDDAALAPLCGGLADPSDAVRQAVAVAFRRLARPSSADCLRRRLGVESSASVKAEIRRTLDALASGGGGAAPVVANAKYYISISPVANGSTRPTSDVDSIIHDAIVQKLGELGGYQVAPGGETIAQAKALIRRRKLKGFYLSVSLDKFDYSGGNLRVRVKIAVFSYPEKDLRGEVPASATMPGARPGDRTSEDQLMNALAAHAVELFAQNFQCRGEPTTTHAATAERGGPYKRSLRNYLLDKRFQLKYTGFIVFVALVISATMGTALYVTTRNLVSESAKVVDESRKVAEESKKVSDVSRMNVKEFASDSPELLAVFNREAAETDDVVASQQKAVVLQQASLLRAQARLIRSLIGGLALLVLAIGVLGIYFTHKVVGPVYKMKRLLKQVGQGNLRVDARLRKGDELQDFFEAFQEMVAALASFERAQLTELETALGALDRKAADDARSILGRLRESMVHSLEG